MIELILGIVIIVLAVAITAGVLMQSGKDKRISSTITGGAADSFYSKGKSKSKDKVLSLITTILSVIFSIVVVAMVIITK